MLDGNAEGEDVVAANAEVDLGNVPEAAENETGTRDQDQGESEFSDDEDATETIVAGTGGRGTAAFFQHVADVLAGGMPCGEAPEENAAEKRCAEGEEEDLEIEVRVGFIGDAELVSGHEAHDAAKEGDGE